MAAILTKLSNTVIAGIVALIVMFVIVGATAGGGALDEDWWKFLFRFLHILSGVMWIGLLYYFNFVQMGRHGPTCRTPSRTSMWLGAKPASSAKRA